MEHIAIKVDEVSFHNLYIPPNSSCSSGYTPSLSDLLSTNEDCIFMGDFNAHDDLWFSPINDTRGSQFADEIGDSNFGVLNEDSPTRVPPNGQATSPDFTLASLSLLPYTKWKTDTSFGSDHLPIIISLTSNIKQIKSEKRTFINFRKADWEKFTEITEEEFEKLPPPSSVYEGEKRFRKIINKASNITIPKGRIKDVFSEIPQSAAAKIQERDNLRKTDPTSPELARLNEEIKSEINKHKKEKWIETVEAIDRKKDSGKLFKLIKHLNGNVQASDNQAIKFKGKYLSKPKDISSAFNVQYSSVVRHTSSKTARTLTKNIRKNSLDGQTDFSSASTKEAIKKAKASKALGPDKISTLHLKHLGDSGITYLTTIFNLSLKHSALPAIWKTSVIIPLLKPKKPADESTSYRPVSLLCPAIKILERLILPTLTENLPIPDIQHGFRKNHSTVSALHDFSKAVSDGFNKRKPPDRTVLLQIDLSKAFDMVSHEKLLADLQNSDLPPHLKRWFKCYISGRQSRVNFRNTLSKCRNVRTGVPQGAVTSPILFNFYLSKLPPPPADVHIIQYADDISVYTSGTDIPAMVTKINNYIDKVADFLSERELLVSAEKSTVTLFTPDTKEAKIHPAVEIKAQSIKLDKTPKLLGINFDTMYCFSHHTSEKLFLKPGRN